MLLKDIIVESIIQESIDVHGEELVAYCIVVAEQYKGMPAFDPSVVELWEQLLSHNKKMMMKILKNVSVEFTAHDPYKNQKQMMMDIIKNNRIQIFKTPNDDAHPGMSAEENDIFRFIHDYLGHYLPNEKSFAKYLAKNNINKPDDPKLNAFRFSSHNFTVRGEMNTYLSHAKILSDKVAPVLFTEIVGQICTYFATGDYTDNKVGIMQGIDFKNIGKFTDQALENRKIKYHKLLMDENIGKFRTTLGIFDKSKIRWNLLSRGEGAKRSK